MVHQESMETEAMSQSSMSESKLKLQALPAIQRQEASLKPDHLLPLSGSLKNQNQINSGEQTPTSNKKPIQTFESIRDPHKSMLQLMDSMFDLLQSQVYEANKANGDLKTQFHLQRPTLEKQSSRSWLDTNSELPAFSGKIYTSDWSLILRGTSEIIICYILPSDRVISLNSNPEIYKPYLSINFLRKGATFGWQIDDQTILPDHLPNLANKLFEKLIKSVRSQQWNESTFCLQTLNGGSTGDHNVIAPAGFEKLSYDPKQLLVEMMETAKEAAASASQFSVDNKNPKSTEETKKPSKIDIFSLSSSKPQTLENALEALVALSDKKLEQLVGEGAEALNKHDFKGAQRVLNLTNQLHEFKNKAGEILALLQES